MKILLKGYYGFGNLGDDILMKTTWGLVKEKWSGSTISIYSNFNENLIGFDRAKSYNEYIFSILEATPVLADWTKAEYYDVVVDGGGGVYFDYSYAGAGRGIFNKIILFIGASRLTFFDKLLRKVSFKEKKLQYKRRIGVGLGIGPYSETSRLLYDHLIEIGLSDVLFVRDEASWHLLDKFNYRGKKFISSDLAFFTRFWLPPGLLRSSRKFENNLGIILQDWHERTSERFSEFKKFADWANGEKINVTFFSFDENNDKKFIREFAPHFKLVIWKPDKDLLKDFLEHLATQDMIFSARAHGVIISSILGIPTVSLGTSKKLQEVSKMFPKSSPLIEEPFSLEKLQHHFKLMVSTYPERLTALEMDLRDNYKMADDTLQIVKNTL